MVRRRAETCAVSARQREVERLARRPAGRRAGRSGRRTSPSARAPRGCSRSVGSRIGRTAASCARTRPRSFVSERLGDVLRRRRRGRDSSARAPSCTARDEALQRVAVAVERLARRRQHDLGPRRRAVVVDLELAHGQALALERHALGVPERGHARRPACASSALTASKPIVTSLDLRRVPAVVADDRGDERRVARQARDADGLALEVARARRPTAARRARPAAAARAPRSRRRRAPSAARSRGPGCPARRRRRGPVSSAFSESGDDPGSTMLILIPCRRSAPVRTAS